MLLNNIKSISFIVGMFFIVQGYSFDKYDIAICEAQPDDGSRVTCYRGLKIPNQSCDKSSIVRELECYRNIANQGAKQKPSTSENNVSNALESKSTTERLAIMTNLLHKSGKGCGKATRVFLQGYDRDAAVYWNVACNNGQEYSIQVSADSSGSTRITECSILNAIGVECFKKFNN